MDVDKLIETAVAEWNDMVDAVEDDTLNPTVATEGNHSETPVGVEQTEAEAQQDAHDETEDDPVGAFIDEPTETEGLPDEPTPEDAETADLGGPDASQMPDDALSAEDEPIDLPERQEAQETYQELPDDPLEEYDGPAVEETSNPVFETQLPDDRMVDPNFKPFRDHKPNGKSESGGINISMSDGWQAELSDTINQRVTEMQTSVHAQLDDELSRVVHQLDITGDD